MDDQVLAKRVANALIKDAGLSSAPLPHKAAISGAVQRYRQAYGGIWVGGKVTLTTSALEFSPNAINRAVNTGELDVRIPLADITAVTVEFGVMTKIIAIESPALTFKVRCYGAEKFADQIRSALPGEMNAS